MKAYFGIAHGNQISFHQATGLYFSRIAFQVSELMYLPDLEITHIGLSCSPILTKNKLLWIPTRAVLAASSSYHP